MDDRTNPSESDLPEQRPSRAKTALPAKLAHQIVGRSGLIVAGILIAISLLAPADWIRDAYSRGVFPIWQRTIVPLTGAYRFRSRACCWCSQRRGSSP